MKLILVKLALVFVGLAFVCIIIDTLFYGPFEGHSDTLEALLEYSFAIGAILAYLAGIFYLFEKK